MAVVVTGVLTGKPELGVNVCSGEKKGVVKEEVPRGFVETEGVIWA